MPACAGMTAVSDASLRDTRFSTRSHYLRDVIGDRER